MEELKNDLIIRINKIMKDEYKSIIIVDKLFDLSKKAIIGLDERETFIIRKMLGILDNGIPQTYESVSSCLGVKPRTIKYLFSSIKNKLSLTTESRQTSKKIIYTGIEFSIPIEELLFSLRICNCLKRNGIFTLGQLLCYSEKELLKLPTFGKNYYDELVTKLHFYGYSLAEEELKNNKTKRK